MILLIFGAVILAEIIALIWLATTVGTYKNFWEQKANESGEIGYLALGDSAAQGIGASSPMRGYVGVIAGRLGAESSKKVRIINLSKTGAKMRDYLEEQAPKIKDIKADFVTIEIGANDIAGFDASTYRADFKKVLESLPDGTYVSNMPLFNSRLGSKTKAQQASEIIAEEIKAYPRLHFVDLQKQTSENQNILGFAPDFFHPNNISYKNWADAFWISYQKTKQ